MRLRAARRRPLQLLSAAALLLLALYLLSAAWRSSGASPSGRHGGGRDDSRGAYDEADSAWAAALSAGAEAVRHSSAPRRAA